MASYLTLQNRVIAMGGYGETDRTRIKDFINVAQDDVCSRSEKWSFLERTTTVTTVAATQTVNIPSGTRTIGRLRPTTPYSLEPTFLDWFTFDDLYFNREAQATVGTGIPSEYSIFGSKFVFNPVPDAVYTYDFQNWGNATALTSDADVSVIPLEHQDVLVYGALMYLAARDKDPNMMSYWQDMYEGKIRAMRADNKLNQSETIQKVSMPGDYYGSFR